MALEKEAAVMGRGRPRAIGGKRNRRLSAGT
jgi:hypothetical protein